MEEKYQTPDVWKYDGPSSRQRRTNEPSVGRKEWHVVSFPVEYDIDYFFIGRSHNASYSKELQRR